MSDGRVFILGACAMTTKFLDNIIFTFKILLSWRFPRKVAFWTIFLPAPLPTPPWKAQILFLLSSRFLWYVFIRIWCRDPHCGDKGLREYRSESRETKTVVYTQETQKKRDAAKRLFCLQLEKLPAYSGAFYLQLTILAFLLTVGAFLLTILAFCLQLELSCLQWGECV